MAKMNLEKLAAERRMKRRGVEQVSGTGYTVDLASRANAGARSAERFIHEAKGWGPVEDVVERNAAARAPQEAHIRAILDACED